MNKTDTLVTLLCGFLGGLLLTALVSYPEASSKSPYRALSIVDKNNKLKIWLGNGAGGGAGIWFNNQKGITRLSAGGFPNGQHASVVLTSRSSNINPKIMFRTEGRNANPMLFFKNKKDQHRIDLGNDINHPDENPYLVYFDKEGKKSHILGNFLTSRMLESSLIIFPSPYPR